MKRKLAVDFEEAGSRRLREVDLLLLSSFSLLVPPFGRPFGELLVGCLHGDDDCESAVCLRDGLCAAPYSGNTGNGSSRGVLRCGTVVDLGSSGQETGVNQSSSCRGGGGSAKFLHPG